MNASFRLGSSAVEQVTLNHLVQGSNPCRGTRDSAWISPMKIFAFSLAMWIALAGSALAVDPSDAAIYNSAASTQNETTSTAKTESEVARSAEIFWRCILPGETLPQIAARHRMTSAELQRYNGMTSDQVRVGQYLRVPHPEIAPPTQKTVTSERPAAAAPEKLTQKATQPATAQVASATSAPAPKPADSFADRIRREARDLGQRDLGYNQSWRPPGNRGTWEMDCSNTARYLYWRAAHINIGRTASTQYWLLRQKGRAWNVPMDGDGLADVEFLRTHLRPGDLLFWEHTYRPRRDPPITHVMVYLGKNEKGDWLMFGSQTWGQGMYGSRAGGPDVYVFKPHQSCGGYTAGLFGPKRRGRFVAIGRPVVSKEGAPVIKLAAVAGAGRD